MHCKQNLFGILLLAMLAVSGVVSRGVVWQCQLARAESLPQPNAIESDANSWRLFRGDSSSTGVAKSPLPDELDVVWKVTVEDGGFEATPAIINETCYIGDLDGTLYAIDLNTGNLRWKKKTASFGFAASPALTKDRMYLGDIDGKFYCFDMQGEVKWEFEAGAEINSSANFLLRDQVLHVLFGSQDATLYCLNAETGKLAWKYEIADQIRCCPTIVEDRAFVAGCDGQLHIIDLQAGKEIAAVNIESPDRRDTGGCGPTRIFRHRGRGRVLCELEGCQGRLDVRGRAKSRNP